MHAPIVTVPVSFTLLGAGGVPAPPYAIAAIPIGLALGGLQVRHSLATIRGLRSKGWRWTLPAITVLAAAPLLLPGWLTTWPAAMWLPLASALMLLRGWTRVTVYTVLSTSMLAAFAVIQAGGLGSAGTPPAVTLTYAVLYDLMALVPPLVLFGAARLVGVVDELHATRDELAALAVTRERLRLSQDLHDVLGQNLSAVSLQGDLALRLLRRDPLAALAEVETLTALARDTLRGMRAVTHGEHRASLRAELDGACALLAAAGIDVTLDVDDTRVPASGQEVFAWAVREGATNVLRHSDARTCSIATCPPRDGVVRLVIRNDGARPAVTGDGNGLRGLADRAAALSGTAVGRSIGDTFELVVELPEQTT
ncbi:histidine kinase [Micromonospora sp. CPCC 205539]|uniref:sensor histidine kinase n=1 Tax=Micromonospora sp. CPCC 205539 TaxID=3122408 RepID=UPI002FF1794B